MLVLNPEMSAGLTVKVVPLANPDGYIHSYTWDRFWRKNRQFNAGILDIIGLGTINQLGFPSFCRGTFCHPFIFRSRLGI